MFGHNGFGLVLECGPHWRTCGIFPSHIQMQTRVVTHVGAHGVSAAHVEDAAHGARLVSPREGGQTRHFSNKRTPGQDAFRGALSPSALRRLPAKVPLVCCHACVGETERANASSSGAGDGAGKGRTKEGGEGAGGGGWGGGQREGKGGGRER